MYIYKCIYIGNVCVCRSFRSGYVDFATHEEAIKALKKTVSIQGGTLNLDMVDYGVERKPIRTFLSCDMVWWSLTPSSSDIVVFF